MLKCILGISFTMTAGAALAIRSKERLRRVHLGHFCVPVLLVTTNNKGLEMKNIELACDSAR